MTPDQALSGLIARFTPQLADLAQEVLEKLRARLPGAVELVDDNHNALAIGFAPSERSSEAIFSIALYPRWVGLFFLQGAKLKDPKKLLQGEGKVVRHLVLEDPADLEMPGVRALITEAIKSAKRSIDPKHPNRIVIKSISKTQRPRRPPGRTATPTGARAKRFPGRRPK